ncbi:MAG: zinc ribbon domain-containing protein [Bacteroidota bacterium]|nr:zinc ribbon domain-containing protein [Bacteroidota bacterium]MDE2833122.1 zinc ribbon domain-containing protein [Bacteroidota bacterium]
MPTYVYRREDGTTFELFQSITADPLTSCPDTGQPVRRVILGGTGFILKGSGFYQTDYVKAPSEEAKNGANTDKADKVEKKANKPAAKKEPEAASDAK